MLVKREKEGEGEGEGEKGRRETGVSQSAVRLSRSAAICAPRNSVNESDRLFQKSAQSLLSNVLCDYRLSGSWRS